MKKELISPKGQYKSGRAYSPAVKVSVSDAQIIFIAGQIPKDESGNIVGLGDIEVQTECVFDKMIEILEESGATVDDLVKVNIYLVDIKNDFEKVSAIRNRYLNGTKPAATTIGITATVCEGCNIEVDAIAVKSFG
jgi:enamine deaminase RidA (YjgF/YER057c/UK114 family)